MINRKNITLKTVAIISLLVVNSIYAQPKLKDNFHKNINYEWLKNTKIPPSKPGVSNFSLVKTDKIDQSLKSIVENPVPKTESEKKLKNAYLSFLNKEKRNQLGILPIKNYLQAIDKVKNHHDLAILMGRFYIDGISSPLDFSVGADLKNSTQNVLIISQSGIYLIREHYINNSERAIKQRKIYAEYLSKFFAIADYKNIKQRVNNVINIETKLAKIQFSPVQNTDLKKIYNIYNYKKLSTTLSNYPLDQVFNVLDIPATGNTLVMQPSYLQGFNQLFKEISVAQWQDYLTTRIFIEFASVLSTEFEEIIFANKKQLGAIDKQPKEWQQGINFINARIPMIAGKAYVEKFFNKKSKDYGHKLVNSIKDEFKFAITNSTIFSEETKKKALYKLRKMTYKIGYPDQWQDFSQLEIKLDDLVGNVIRINNYNYNYSLAKLNKKVNKSDWEQAPHLVNAFYDPTKNKFILLAGILNPPFFDINATDAQNYGGIGSVIAHEIGHGFDHVGREFDAGGNLNNWWTDKDKIAFDRLKNQLITQINNYQPFPNVRPDGRLKVGEVIGDLNGFQVAFDAYSKLAKRQGTHNLNSSKKFFVKYATIWRSKLRREFALRIIAIDPHPLGEYRTNGTFKNIDAFYDVFEIKPEDGMYIKPSERVKMW